MGEELADRLDYRKVLAENFGKMAIVSISFDFLTLVEIQDICSQNEMAE